MNDLAKLCKYHWAVMIWGQAWVDKTRHYYPNEMKGSTSCPSCLPGASKPSSCARP